MSQENVAVVRLILDAALIEAGSHGRADRKGCFGVDIGRALKRLVLLRAQV